jgi:UDP-N-acetylmuramate: L-alanyl-gamma-D-glutamyl-meso-diaminopimelate ligase
VRIHFLGICGYAVSGLALTAKDLGHQVTGSDEDAYPPTTEILTRAGIPWVNGHTAENLTRWGRPDFLVQGNQVRAGNPEAEAARALGLRVVSEAQFWGELTSDRFRIVVCGSHGKTTTAGLIAWILRVAGRDPGYRLGMTVPDLGAAAAAWGTGREFVFEGDEYTSAVFDPRPKFLHFAPNLVILTNVDWDHPDVFPDPQAYEAAFKQLVVSLRRQDRLIACSDDASVRRLLASSQAPTETYGLKGEGDWQGRDIATEEGTTSFTAWHAGNLIAEVCMKLSGEHNVANALASLVAAARLEVPVSTAVEAIAQFHGADRRLEIRGEVRGITVIDDYAHHPSEVRATLQAVRSRFPAGRILACFVPHTFSRTFSLLDRYAGAFPGCAMVLIAPIEPARERHLAQTVTARDVVERIRGVPEVSTVETSLAAAQRLAAGAGWRRHHLHVGPRV